LIRSGNVGVAYRDLEAAERVVNGAGLDALAVRPVTLTPGAPTGHAGAVSRYGILSTIRRSDVARWMLDAAEGGGRFAVPSVLLGRS
jgi:hypothetical protein